MRTPSFPLSSLVLFTALLIGCGGTDSPAGRERSQPNTIASSLERDLNPDPTPAQMSALVEGNNALTLDLYRTMGDEGGNFMVSTLSIRTTFAMAYAGARGVTAAEMSTVLRFDPDQPRLHEAMNALDLTLQRRQLEADVANELEPIELRQANAFWGQTGFPWLEPYLDTLAVNYGAGIFALDFAAEPERSRLTINDWVEGRTNDRIRGLLPPGAIGPATVAVLTNAVYFKAPWAFPFAEETTAPDTFETADGTTTTVDFMAQVAELPYATRTGWSAVELPYRGDALSMVILVPEAGTFDTFDAALAPELFNVAIDGLRPTTVALSMPKFEFETELGLKSAFVSLGMPTAFTGAGDFGGMVTGGGLYIDDAYHKTFVAVNEAGTEASAATGIAFAVSLPNVEATLRIDRPFYFLIRDRQTNVWLFFGRVSNPAV